MEIKIESIKLIKDKLQAASIEELPALIEYYAQDERKGVVPLVTSFRKRINALEAEKERICNMLAYERQCRKDGLGLICGIDEAGRGPLAGPVVAAAVILPENCDILYIDDSKKLSAKKREELYDLIMSEAIAVGTGMVDCHRIDEINILQSTYEAMKSALLEMKERYNLEPEILLNDAVKIPGVDILQVPIIGGDAKSLSIAAASIVAKVTRDRMMIDYDSQYPKYGFALHKGYGTEAHRNAIEKYGPCPIHRLTFIKKQLDKYNANTASGLPEAGDEGDISPW